MCKSLKVKPQTSNEKLQVISVLTDLICFFLLQQINIAHVMNLDAIQICKKNISASKKNVNFRDIARKRFEKVCIFVDNINE